MKKNILWKSHFFRDSSIIRGFEISATAFLVDEWVRNTLNAIAKVCKRFFQVLMPDTSRMGHCRKLILGYTRYELR